MSWRSTVRTIASQPAFMLLAFVTRRELADGADVHRLGAGDRAEALGPGATQFAYLFLPVIVGIVGGAFVSGRLAGRIPGDRQIAFGFAATIGGVAISVALHLVTTPPIIVQQVLITLAAAGVQLVIPVLVLRMLDLFPAVRGSAASVQTCVMLRSARSSWARSCRRSTARCFRSAWER